MEIDIKLKELSPDEQDFMQVLLKNNSELFDKGWTTLDKMEEMLYPMSSSLIKSTYALLLSKGLLISNGKGGFSVTNK